MDSLALLDQVIGSANEHVFGKGLPSTARSLPRPTTNQNQTQDQTQKQKQKQKQKQNPPKQKQKQKQNPPKPKLEMTARSVPVAVWTEAKHVFTHVLPFYSHTNRSKKEKRADELVGVDRRVFSNLFRDNKLLSVPCFRLADETNLMLHDFLATTPAVCSENFFQAAKCQLEADARFVMSLDEKQSAAYGQGRMVLTDAHRQQLVELGVAPEDFTPAPESDGSGTQPDVPQWIRGSVGRCPLRPDWETQKHDIMLHILRAKFMKQEGGEEETLAQQSFAALLKRAAEGQQWLLVEHTRNDRQWGDGADGSGRNLLGKALTHLLLEARGVVKPAGLLTERTDGHAHAFAPNSGLVDYTFVDPAKALADSRAAKIQAKAAAQAKGKAKADRKAKNERDCQIDWLCVLDFEATCDKDTRPEPQEIIEFPTLLFDVNARQVVDEFHEYVTPTENPTITAFCTELTGITQTTVDAGKPLKAVLKEHREWLITHQLGPESPGGLQGEIPARGWCYLTCGDWDLRTCLRKQLRSMGIKHPPRGFQTWINIKLAYKGFYGKSATGMAGMLEDLAIPLVGRHHSGIDDCRNIAKIVQRMLADGWVPKPTTSMK